MRIYFLGKNTKKTKSFSLELIVFFLVIFVAATFYAANQYIQNKLAFVVENNTATEQLNVDLEIQASPKELDMFIKQISELHTRLEYIDQQTERIQQVMKKQIVGKEKLPKLEKKDKLGGAGGPFINDDLQEKDIRQGIDNLLAKVEARELQYNKMEAIMMKQSVLKVTLPTLFPVNVPYRSSSYGWRHDPILGIRAFHNGLDFTAAQGEPIKVTASGIVTKVGKAPDYGNFVVVNHGDQLETRYAHASKILVNEGDIVEREDVIALVGNTGRSTGPHLHYEIRYKGRSLDPRQYLKK